MTDLQALLNDAINEISDRVRASPEYVRAVDATEACVRKLEFDPETVMSDAFEDDAAAMEIFDSYATGGLDHRAAIAELELIVERREGAAAALSTLNDCGQDVSEVERRLVAAEQLRYLESHPGFVDGIAARFQPALERLAKFMT